MDEKSFQKNNEAVDDSVANNQSMSAEGEPATKPIFSEQSKKKMDPTAKRWAIGCGIAVGVVIITLLIIALTDYVGQNDYNCHYGTVIDANGNEHTECLPVAEKPIIYLYPAMRANISVRLGAPEKLTASYPSYNDGWQVVAEPDGRLTDIDTGRELYSLYWEGAGANYGVKDEGFVVESRDAAKFLEEKLAILGLNEREAEEFIIYWLPKMQKNKYNYVRFASSDEIESYMPLDVTPTPDTVIRVMMILKGLDEWRFVQPQQLTSAPERSGFTVVEWGGSEE